MAVVTTDIAKKIAPDKPYPQTVRALAEKWEPIFGLPSGWVISHCYVESSNRPGVYNPRGNAYGLMQIKPGTATDILRWIKAAGLSKDPRVKEVLTKAYTGQPSDLFNPEFNIMLGAFYLGYIKKKCEETFGDGSHEVVAASYNQGPGAVRKAKREGYYPNKEMSHYIAKIEEAKEKGYA